MLINRRVLIERSKKTVMLLSCWVISVQAIAGDWKSGIQISTNSGVYDVADLYENNLKASPFVIDVDVTVLPVGVGYRGQYLTDSSIVYEIDLGPAFVIAGDAEHIELPIYATVGYAFNTGANSGPYLRAGIAYHFVDGDYAVSESPGLLVALGYEFGKSSGVNWGLEFSVDDSTVEFEDASRLGNTELNTYDSQFTLFFMF